MTAFIATMIIKLVVDMKQLAKYKSSKKIIIDLNLNQKPMQTNQSDKPQRIDCKYILHEIEHVLHFERGILYTIKELSIRPGECVRKFISEDRTRLIKPIIFIIISSLIYTIITGFLHIGEGYISMQGDKNSSLNIINTWVQSHLGYSNIALGVFISLWIKVFFKKYDFNIFEILIAMCFYMGIGMIIYSAVAVLSVFIPFDVIKIGGIPGRPTLAGRGLEKRQ